MIWTPALVDPDTSGRTAVRRGSSPAPAPRPSAGRPPSRPTAPSSRTELRVAPRRGPPGPGGRGVNRGAHGSRERRSSRLWRRRKRRRNGDPMARRDEQAPLHGHRLRGGGATIVPRHVLGGPGFVAPSDKVNVAIIGAGGQGRTTSRALFQEKDCQVDRDRRPGGGVGPQRVLLRRPVGPRAGPGGDRERTTPRRRPTTGARCTRTSG